MNFFITEWSGKKILSGFFPGSGSGLEKSRIRICFVLRDWIRPDIETLETPINAIDKNWKKLTQPWSKVAHLSGSDSILASSCQIGVEYSEKQKKNIYIRLIYDLFISFWYQEIRLVGTPEKKRQMTYIQTILDNAAKQSLT